MNKSNKLVYGIGVKGNGSSWVDGQRVRSYSIWSKMLERCYCQKRLLVKPQYKDCTVCDEWLNYEVFKVWFDKNYIDGYHLDKDLLNQGNKEYSPKLSVFIPQEINNLLTANDAKRGSYPLGVNIVRPNGKFRASISKYGKKETIGFYLTEDEASKAYKEEKTSHVKKVAEDQFALGLIGASAYKALLEYKI